MKLGSVSSALRGYGPAYRFRTPVYGQGTVAAGTVTGNLGLGRVRDLSFGLRERRNGTTRTFPARTRATAMSCLERSSRRAIRWRR